MLIVMRLAIWLVETLLAALLLGLTLIGLFGYDQHAFGKSLELYVSGIILLSFTTGYLLTTAVARGTWRGQQVWPYSFIAVTLFLIHSQIFFVLSGGSTRSDKLSIQIAGCFIVFVCTFLGSAILRQCVTKRRVTGPSTPPK
jgi:hypothetical protein